jgi:hypothetical protein
MGSACSLTQCYLDSRLVTRVIGDRGTTSTADRLRLAQTRYGRPPVIAERLSPLALPMACHGSCQQSEQPPRHAARGVATRPARKAGHGRPAALDATTARPGMRVIMATTTPDNNELKLTRSAMALAFAALAA